MDELIAILLSVQDRMEALINQIDSGAVRLTETGPGSKDGNQNYCSRCVLNVTIWIRQLR